MNASKNSCISIIIPVYNTSKYLRKTFDSILSQTYKEWELIAVDDGSTDESGSICDEYAKKEDRIKVVHKTNGGVSSARNKGIEQANGRYISFVDADDYLEQDFLETMLHGIEQYAADLVCCRVAFDSKQGIRYQKASKISIFNQKESIVAMLLPNSFHGWPWNKMYKSSIIKENKLRFDENLKYCEDEVFVLQYIMYINKCTYIPDALYHYVQNEHSVNNSIYTTRKFNYACLDRHKADEINLAIIKSLHDDDLLKAFNARMFDSFLATSDKLMSSYNGEKDVWRFITRSLRKYYFYHICDKRFRRNWVIETKFLIRVISPILYKMIFVK